MHRISVQDSNVNDKRHQVRSAPVYGDAPNTEEFWEEDKVRGKGGWSRMSITPEQIVLATWGGVH